MKKSFFIIFGIILILVVIGVWSYLFVYGTPDNSKEVFARFGLGGEEREPTVLPETTIVDVSETTNTGALQKLRQLTTRPVAGAMFTGTGILYVEQGTGHIYHINFSSGGETLISGTTIPQTHEAVFSDGGAYAAITSLEGGARKTVVGSVTTEGGAGALDGASLPLGATEVSFGNATGTLMYLLKNQNGSVGYLYNLEKETSTQVFSIPLRDVRVLWGNPLYVYTSPTLSQIGHVYKIMSGSLSYVTGGAPGTFGFRYGDDLLVTKLNDSEISSFMIAVGGLIAEFPLYVIPEKCTTNDVVLYCAVPRGSAPQGFPDNWYKGEISLGDALWNINVNLDTAELMSNFVEESGREIDVKKIGTNTSGELIYFINKNDNTLWMFDTTL
jgi:hypothetical protein